MEEITESPPSPPDSIDIPKTKRKMKQYPRTEGQQKSLLLARQKLKEKIDRVKEQKMIEQEMKRKEIEEKVIKKAIAIKKKEIKKRAILEDISDDETETEKIKELVKKIEKKKEVIKPDPLKVSFKFV